MLNQLQYKVVINRSSGDTITLQANHSFKEGLTAITGPNGNGKSFNLEMIGFLLHGTEALRGKMDDYESIDGQLDFELKGRTFRVNRTKSKATLFEVFADAEGVPRASGTKAVNSKIIELFGYSSDVFNVANLCKQGKIEELGDMKPTARKQLVDETIGLNVLDELTSFVDEERKRLSGGIKAVESILVAPQEPENPGLEFDSQFFKGGLDHLRVKRDQRNIVRVSADKVLVEPQSVSLEADDYNANEYQRDMETRAALMTEYTVIDKQLKALPETPEVLVNKLEEDDAKLEEYQGMVQKHDELSTEMRYVQQNLDRYKYTLPVMEQAEIDMYEARNVLVARWIQKVALKKKNVPHDCPKCQHHWEDEDPRLKAEYGDVPDERPEGDIGTKILADAILNRGMYLASIPFQQKLDELTKGLEKLDVVTARASVARILATREAFHKSQVALSVETQRLLLTGDRERLLANFTKTTDWSERLSAISTARAKVSTYQTLYTAYLEQVKERDEARAALKAFAPDLDDSIIQTEESYVKALNYETNLAAYKKAKESYDKAMESLEALRTELTDWENGRAAIVDLRAKVKGYLLPSLNSVASGLINQMTGGELSWIVVNDQFEITVEGQRIETLSGGGKTVANLALRIGLGQVLTNRVFSVLMLDEIDAAADNERAKYIALCLQHLTKIIKQIVQVSHKEGLVADHYIRL